MIRTLLVALALLLGTSQAEAAMMVHYDLSGLLLQSDSVVIAERVGTAGSGYDTRGQYKITRAIKGTRKVGEQVEIYDSLYVTRGHTIEPRVVLFLSTYEGKPQLVSSGMRVVEAGKVWRFEQHDNPGPFAMVPQGRDPQDQWNLGGAQLDFAGLERAITDAQKRVDGLVAAKAITDVAKRRAAVLALFPAPSNNRGGGFYIDLLAERARVVLADAGDLEGALLVDLRDRGMTHRSSDFAKVPALVALAKDPKRAIEVRVAALAVAARGFALSEDLASLDAIATLIDDADPVLRSAAIAVAARPAQMMTSDQALQRKLNAWSAKIRGLIAKRYATEQDPRVIAAILEAYEDSFRKPAPSRSVGPRAIALVEAHETLMVAVYCTRPTRVTSADLVIKSGTTRVPTGAFNVQVHCADSSSTGGGAGSPPAGTYELSVELTLQGGSKQTVPAGKLTVDANGDRHVTN